MKKTFRHNEFTVEFADEGTGKDNRYFSFTGEIGGSSGACGDTIVKIYPAFQILADLHLAKLDGEPMHALENGFYFFKESSWDIKALEKYWKVDLTADQKERCFKKGVNAWNEETKEPLKLAVAAVMEEVRPLWAEKVKAAYALVKSTPSDLTEIDESISIDDYDSPEKVRALASWLDVHFSTITENKDRYTVQGIEYLVLTDEEADQAQDEEFNNYLEECVFPDLPENMKRYFDRDAWKKDAKHDGRGHCLNHYDGDENESEDPETKEMFFIYRQ